jgi:hypothetical protein
MVEYRKSYFKTASLVKLSFMEENFKTKQRKMDYTEVQKQVKFLQGKVLTVLEASFTNESQLKAVKDLVNKMFSEQLSRICQECFPELPIKSKDHIEEITGVDTDDIVEDVLGVN